MDRTTSRIAALWARPPGGWWDVLKQVWAASGLDNISLIAAGVAFYAFLSIVPLLGAVVLTYGLAADPQTVGKSIAALTDVMPREVAKLIGEQLLTVVEASGGKKGFGLILALGLALYGAMKGAGAVVTALNVAFEVPETRGIVRQYALALAITAGAVLLMLGAMATIALATWLGTLAPWSPSIVPRLLALASYVVLAGMAIGGATTLYRFGPDRQAAHWAWLTPGSVVATLCWLAMTVGFGLYVANFGSYDATYGSLGAIVVMLTWLWLSAYVVLLGAELIAGLERSVAGAPKTGGLAEAAAHPPAPAPAAPSTGVGGFVVADRIAGRAGLFASVVTAGGLGALRRGRGWGWALVLAGAAAAWTTRDHDSA